MNIKMKVIVSMVVVLSLSTMALVFVAHQSYKNSLNLLGEETLQGARQAFLQLEQGDIKMLSAVSTALKTNESLLKAYADRKRDKVYELAKPIYKNLKDNYGITHWNMIDPPPASVVFARLSKPELYNDTIKRVTYLNSVKSGSLSFGKEVGKTGFVLRTITPVVFKDKVIGYQEIGEDIDKFFDLIKKQTKGDIALIVDKKFMNHKEWQSTRLSKKMEDNWDEFKDNLIVSNTSASTAMLPTDINVAGVAEEGTILGTLEQDGKVFQRSMFPVQDATQKPIGCVVIVQDITKISAEMMNTRTMLIIFTVVLAVALCAVIVWLLNALVFKRLNNMIETITRVVGGDVAYQVKETDEIGKFEAQLIGVLRSILS